MNYITFTPCVIPDYASRTIMTVAHVRYLLRCTLQFCNKMRYVVDRVADYNNAYVCETLAASGADHYADKQ